MHRDWHQVTLDVPRSLTRQSSRARPRLCRQLEDLLHACMARNPRLYYYQGFGDICAFFLLIFGEEKALPVVETVANLCLQCVLNHFFI